MSSVHAPYGFVPLNTEVFLPEWAGIDLQDRPATDAAADVVAHWRRARGDVG